MIAAWSRHLYGMGIEFCSSLSPRCRCCAEWRGRPQPDWLEIDDAIGGYRIGTSLPGECDFPGDTRKPPSSRCASNRETVNASTFICQLVEIASEARTH